MNEKIETVRFFEAHCSDCNDAFGVPLLSDFAYGEFILKSEDGKTFAYMNAMKEKNFDLISNLFKELSENSSKSRTEQGDYSFLAPDLNKLHWVIAQCADEVGGKKLSNQFRCPKCGSTNVTYGNDVMIRDGTIPKVSFNTFSALSESEKYDRVRELYIVSKGLF